MDDEDSETGRLVGREKLPTRSVLEHFSTSGATSSPISVAALCEVKRYVEDEAEHTLENSLLVLQIWKNHIEEI